MTESYYEELMGLTNHESTIKFLNSMKSLADYLGQGFVPEKGTFSRL